MKRKRRKNLLFFVCLLLIFTLGPLFFSKNYQKEQSSEQAYADENIGGKITVDKYRDKYELRPGETTKVTLEIKAEPVTIPKPATVILTLDMSGSMAQNDSLEPTLTAARRAAEILTANNGQVTEATRKTDVALVRYDTIASVYDFKKSNWVALDQLGTIEKLSSDNCFSSEYKKIDSALNTEKIASSVLDGSILKVNNYLRSNDFSAITGWDKTNPIGTNPYGEIDYLQLAKKSNTRAMMFYKESEDFTTYTEQVKKNHIQGTNIEAGAIVTQLVAAKMKDSLKDVYPIFMTDGVPTIFQFGGEYYDYAPNGEYGSEYIENYRADGFRYTGPAFKWVANAAGTLPVADDEVIKQTLAAANNLRQLTNSTDSKVKKIFAVGVNKGFDTHEQTISAAMNKTQGDVFAALNGDRGTAQGTDSLTFITDDPATKIQGIYEAIAKNISADPVTSNITVTDIVPNGFTLTADARKAIEKQAKDLGGTVKFFEELDQSVKIVWSLPGLLPNVPVELNYDLKAKHGSYGILNTNQEATLEYETFCPGIPGLDAKDPNNKKIYFPKPQIKLHPAGGQDDHYVMPDNQTAYQLSNQAVVKKNVTGIDPRQGSIATEGKIVGNDQISKLVDDKPYDERTNPRFGDRVPDADRNVKSLRIVMRPKTSGGEGTSTASQIGKCDIVVNTLSGFELKYQPNPLRDPDNGYTVKYEYRYESAETDPAYVSPWYTITIDVPAKQKRAAIQFEKKDEDETLLSGVDFELYKDMGNGQPDGTAPRTTTTGGQGIGKFDNLVAGKYLVKEKQAPEGYRLDEKYYPVEITQTDQNNERTVTVTSSPLINYFQTATIKLKKVDESEKPLAGAVFGLFEAADEEFKNPRKITSEDDGFVVFKDVKLGKYYVKELSAPTGFQTANWISEEIEITAAQDKKTIDLGSVLNKRIIQTFDLEVIKIGSDREKLENAVFKLTNTETGETSQVNTDAEGQFTITDLKFGTYELEEIQAPVGYQLSTGKYQLLVDGTSVNVTFDGEDFAFGWLSETVQQNPVLILEIMNKRMPALPKTGSLGRVGLMSIGGLAMFFGLVHLFDIRLLKRRR